MIRRQIRKSLTHFIAVAAILLPAEALRAETFVPPDVHVQHDGVKLDAYSRNGQITFCFGTESGVRIASEYGIEFKVPRGQTRLWNEALPKLVAGKQPYFDLPVRIDLRTRGAPVARQVSIGLGVCVSAAYCTPVTFEIAIPGANNVASNNPTCSN